MRDPIREINRKRITNKRSMRHPFHEMLTDLIHVSNKTNEIEMYKVDSFIGTYGDQEVMGFELSERMAGILYSRYIFLDPWESKDNEIDDFFSAVSVDMSYAGIGFFTEAKTRTVVSIEMKNGRKKNMIPMFVYLN